MDVKIVELENSFKKITIRGQVTFLLAVAEMVMKELESDNHGIFLARSGISDAWKWSSNLDVSGDELCAYVDSPDEDKDLGVRELYYQKQNNPTMIAAVITITCVIGYIARQAYILEGETSFPSTIEIIDRDFVGYIMETACQTRIFDLNKASRIMNYLEKTCLSDNPEEELGCFISRDEIMLI